MVVQSIEALPEAVRATKIQMAIVTVPAPAAATIIDVLARQRVRAVLNFAPVRAKVPRSVELINIDLSIELEKLAHFLGKKERLSWQRKTR